MYVYRAHIVPPGGHEDPLSQEAAVSVTRRTEDGKVVEVLRMTDKGWFWARAEEGTQAAATLVLPTEAFAALLTAVGRFSGAPSEPRTEAAVLREWLKAEQTRVQSILDLLIPKVIDYQAHPFPVMSKPGTIPGTRVEGIT